VTRKLPQSRFNETLRCQFHARDSRIIAGSKGVVLVRRPFVPTRAHLDARWDGPTVTNLGNVRPSSPVDAPEPGALESGTGRLHPGSEIWPCRLLPVTHLASGVGPPRLNRLPEAHRPSKWAVEGDIGAGIDRPGCGNPRSSILLKAALVGRDAAVLLRGRVCRSTARRGRSGRGRAHALPATSR
jgi:hypothetical protein